MAVAKIQNFQSFQFQIKGMYPSIVRLGTIHRPFLCEVGSLSQVESLSEVMMILTEPVLRLDCRVLTAMIESYLHL